MCILALNKKQNKNTNWTKQMWQISRKLVKIVAEKYSEITVQYNCWLQLASKSLFYTPKIKNLSVVRIYIRRHICLKKNQNSI